MAGGSQGPQGWDSLTPGAGSGSTDGLTALDEPPSTAPDPLKSSTAMFASQLFTA